MREVQKHIGIWLLLLGGAAAQNTPEKATVQDVAVVRDGTGLRVEVTLSSPVKPWVETAVHPSRILLDLRETVCTDKIKKIDVHGSGIKRVRTEQHSTSPVFARVIVELDQEHTYSWKAEGNRIV